MAFYLSPRVDARESDQSNIIGTTVPGFAAIVLRGTYKGPENKKILISNVNNLYEMFGYPIISNEGNRDDMASAEGFLSYASGLYCTRVMPEDATFAGCNISYNASTSTSTFTPHTSASAYTLSDFSTKDPDDFADEVDSTMTANDFLWVIANSRGKWGNYRRISIINKYFYDLVKQADSSVTDHKLYATVSAIDSDLESDSDFLIIVEGKSQENISDEAKPWTALEYFNVSTKDGARDDLGGDRFVESAINNKSNEIKVVLGEAWHGVDIPQDLYSSDWTQFGGGFDDNPDPALQAGVDEGDIITAYELYSNAEEFDISMLIDGNKTYAVKSALKAIAESRRDCTAKLDPPKATIFNNKGNEVNSLREWRYGTGAYTNNHVNFSSSYIESLVNWGEKYDKFNKKYYWVPLSGYYAGLHADVMYRRGEWFAPAGFENGQIKGIRKLAWNPTQAQRDEIYKLGFNPAVAFAKQGKVVWGQKNLLAKESAFNRINVRWLFITIEKAIANSARFFLFEQNDSITRTRFINMVTPYLRNVVQQRGIYDFAVVCDTRNNTPERIDRGEFWCDIYIKPTRVAEVIVLNFIGTSTGTQFSELIAQNTQIGELLNFV